MSTSTSIVLKLRRTVQNVIDLFNDFETTVFDDHKSGASNRKVSKVPNPEMGCS